MTHCNCKSAKSNMTNAEANLRAKLLVKSAELSDIKNEYNALVRKYKSACEKIQELESEIAENNLQTRLKLSFYEGKLSGYEEVFHI